MSDLIPNETIKFKHGGPPWFDKSIENNKKKRILRIPAKQLNMTVFTKDSQKEEEEEVDTHFSL